MLALLVALELLMPPDGPGYRGEIRGQIRDVETLAPVPDALVFLYCGCLRRGLMTKTDAQGSYAFVGLPAGEYSVETENQRTRIALTP